MLVSVSVPTQSCCIMSKDMEYSALFEWTAYLCSNTLKVFICMLSCQTFFGATKHTVLEQREDEYEREQSITKDFFHTKA